MGDDKVGGKQIQEVQIEDSKSDNLAHTSTTTVRRVVFPLWYKFVPEYHITFVQRSDRLIELRQTRSKSESTSGFAVGESDRLPARPGESEGRGARTVSMARGATTVRVRDPPPAARRGATPEGAGSAGASLPGVSGAGQPRAGGRAQATQTSEGAVRPGGKPRHHSNPLLTSAVPSKAECLSDLRLFQLVRDGTYDEVLQELLERGLGDAEAAWIRTKLLRLVQRHRQRTYGSIRNAVTSKRKELTPDVNASTAQNLDTQLPALERPSGEAVAQRLMRDLAVLHDLQPAPLTEGQARPTHEQIYVREAVYVEAELSRSRASSPQGLSRATSPLVDELSLSQSLSGELSANSLVSNAPSTPLAELSASSKSEHGRGGRLGALSTPPFVNRHSWDPRHALPGNDASQRDRRMNSPVGDNPSRGDWSRLSYSPLPARKKHGVWGTAWRHPSDLFKTKPGIDCSGIKTLNSKEFGRVSALIDDLHGRLRWSSTNSLSFSAPRSAWPAAPPKMGSVRLARESAQKEAELFAEEHRALRLEQTEQDIAEVDSHANNFSETIDKAVFEEIQNAQELWENASDAMPPLDSSTLSQARMDEAMQLVLKIENAQKKKEQELKAAIQEIWKSDLVAAALQREEATSHSIYATIFAIDQHAASLAAGRLEVARKRVEKEEAALQRYEQEMSVHDQRFLDEQQSSAASAAGLAEAQSKRDAIALEVGKRQEQVDKYNHDLAHFKSQISKFEADAYSASRQGNPKVVESFKARADEVRERSLSLRATLDDALEELSDMNLKFESLEADFIQWENIVHKDQLRLEETEKVCARDRERKQELEEKVMAEKQDEKEMAKLFEERSAVAQAAKQKAKEQHDAELQSSVTVIDRLRASSLALVAKILLSSQDLELNVEEQEPVYIGERLDGKRHGFGILQVCI